MGLGPIVLLWNTGQRLGDEVALDGFAFVRQPTVERRSDGTGGKSFDIAFTNYDGDRNVDMVES
jgi:hypothetical protein